MRGDAQFPLDNQTPHCDNPPAGNLLNHNQEILIAPCGHPCIPLCPRRLGDVADGGEYTEHVEEAVVVVGGVQGAEEVAFGEGGGDGGGD